MQCKYHPNREAELFCANCNAPLCKECVEDVRPGVTSCFHCAMLLSVSDVGSSLVEKHERATEKKISKGKKWGPFHYFMVVSSVMILIMWGFIIFGGKPAPARTAEFTKKGRVFLFMVNSALKRYSHREGNRYPERLSQLIPKYLALPQSDLFHLKKLKYELNDNGEYRLSLANPKKRDMKFVLTPTGIVYNSPSKEG